MAAFLKAPFPWFGGKSRVAEMVWERFGAVPNYVEPFAGSLAVLLGRPTNQRVETVNDLDCWIANFWRAIREDSDAVADAADWPVNEADLHARHLWLVNQIDFRERMKTDPDYFEAKIAGWWAWGICQWIGSGWCSEPGWRGRTNAGRMARGLLAGDKRPLLSGHSGGVGVHKKSVIGVSRQLPHLSDRGPGTGVHSAVANAEGRPRPHCSFDQGVHKGGLYDWLFDLQQRLRRVRVCCGDWTRVLGPSVTFKIGLTGIFLDPPYDMRVVSNAESDRDGAAPSDKLYENHDNDLSAAVRRWAIDNGDNPLLRIALCGYEGEHTMPDSWECMAWKANGGFANQKGRTRGKINAHRERIWFSPACLKPGLFSVQPELGELEEESLFQGESITT